MSSSSKFVIGSDDEQLDEDMDYKHAYDNLADPTQSSDNKQTIKQSSYQSAADNNNNINNELLSLEDEYKPLNEIIDISEYYQFQKISHKIIYPLLWLCDSKIIRE
eukprot:308245_1